MFTSIKSKIFLSHFILIVIILMSLSYKHYVSSLDSYINNMITSYNNSSSSIITTSSLAISGFNYGNIQLPSFIDEVKRNEKLLYLCIRGTSDYTSKKFKAVYDNNLKTIYRNNYPDNYKTELENKLKKLEKRKNNLSSDKVKLDFLIDRTNDKIHHYEESISFSKKINNNYLKIIHEDSSYIDYEHNILHLKLNTTNKNGGVVSMLFDVSEISDIKSKILNELVLEMLIAMILSIVILNILSNKITDPLNKLSKYMSNDFQTLDEKDIPELKSKDEIGILARTFNTLLQTVQEKQKTIEKKAYYDNLTGLYNRHKFDEVFNKEIKRSQRYLNNFSMAIIDIDKFKDLNDKYGHLQGDDVLIRIAKNLNFNVRKTDTLARWGGEEFIILLNETSILDAKIVAKNLKNEIEKLEHDIVGIVTVSIGISEYNKNDSFESIFKRCDDALYIAKEKGRNRVEVL